MPTIEDMSPYPGTPGDIVTVNGVDIGVCTQAVLTYLVPGSGTDPGAGVEVNTQSVALTRVSQTQVTFTMPDFGLVANEQVQVKALFTQNAVQSYTNVYNYETGPTLVTPPPAAPPPVHYGYDVPTGPMAYPLTRVPWAFFDPYDSDPTTNTYNLPVNPNSMTSPFGERPLTIAVTTAVDGQTLMFEGRMRPVAWQFSGVLLEAAEYDKFRSWVYERNRRVVITDHFGREITCVMTKFDPTPQRANGRYWKHSYTISATVLSVSKPTRIPA